MNVTMVDPVGGVGGPQHSLLEFAEYLSGRHTVSLVAPPGRMFRVAESRRFSYRPLEIPGSRDQKSQLRSIAALIRLARSRSSPDVLHANGISALNLVGPAAVAGRIPVVLHFHASELPARARAELKMWTRLLPAFRIAAVSDFSFGLLLTHLPDRVSKSFSVLPNPVCVERFPRRSQTPSAPLRVGFFGGGIPNKGLDWFLDVAEACGPGFQWSVYGVDAEDQTRFTEDGRQRASVGDLKTRVSWATWADDVTTAYASVDVVTVLSRRESFSRIALEGMASGCPVVAWDIPGVREVVWPGVSGLLCRQGDIAAAARALCRLRDEQQTWSDLSSGAIRAVARFDVTNVGATLESLYADLAS